MFYDILYFLGLIFYLPSLILKGKWHAKFPMRFGCCPKELEEKLKTTENIWIHAVSVGEILAVAKLIHTFHTFFPNNTIVLSTATQTGYTIAQSKFNKEAVVLLAPLDFSFVVKKFIRLINPKMYIIAETEIWPNLFGQLIKKKIPIIVVNGRISDKAFKGYKRVKVFLKQIISRVNVFGMQSAMDAQRIKELGALESSIHLTGNLKFDDFDPKEQQERLDLGFRNNEDIWIAGSTHPGEEEIILTVFQKLLKGFPKIRLVIAPRHIERAEEVIKLISQKGFSAVKFTEVHQHVLNQKTIIVVNTLGHLRTLYSLARVVFVGKSLVGRGGQNIIEPAFFGRPILVGPNMDNFKSIVEMFLREKAIIQVQNVDELYQKIYELLRNPQQINLIGNLARNIVQKNQGATMKTIDLIKKFL